LPVKRFRLVGDLLGRVHARRKAMDPKPSVMEVLARLEEQIAHNDEREAFHAGHEAFHRDQRRSYGCQPELTFETPS
jgi:hypothetical protein